MSQTAPAAGRALLEIRNLQIAYEGAPVVEDVSLSMAPGEILGVVGESGCGKSTLLGAVLRILGSGWRVSGGEIRFEGRELLSMGSRELRRLRGERLGAVFQNPGDSLNPSRRIRTQFEEALRAHRNVSRAQAREIAAEMMGRLHLDHGRELLEAYPFQLSGGMNQRVALALAMVMEPALLLADEPTSALDVTVQAQVIREMLSMRAQFGTAILIVTHNMGVVAHMADRVAVMYAGRVVEYGNRDQVLHSPAHPYTRSLLRAIPDFSGQLPRGLPGAPPPFGRRETGCAFAPRCPLAAPRCRGEAPALRAVAPGHWAACPGEEGACV